MFAGAVALAPRAQAAGCEEHFDSTFAVVQKIVFERHGCTSVACHSGAAPAGSLDLSAGASYDALVDHPPQSIAPEAFPGVARVVPGNKARSLLWLNVAAATQPSLWTAPLRPMPQGGLPPLSLDELDLIRLWIENGAPRDGVVPGTADLFDVCLPPPEPLRVQPLPPPPAGVGIQLRAPHQVLPPRTERETCFVSYYDVTDQVPSEVRGPDGTTFRYKRIDARQDPLSHHAVTIVYTGRAAIDDPVWGPFACRGGAGDGQPCDPKQLDACGADGVCASPPVPSVACIGFGPGDAGIGVGEDSLFNTMGSGLSSEDGIYDEAPLKGILVWNSHAFNVTDAPAGLDMWINFDFAAPAEQKVPLRRFVDISAIADMHVPPFGTEEICQQHVLPPGSRLVDLASHTHQRGKRFRIFTGAFACRGGAHDGHPCSPFGVDPGLPSPDLCAGAPCESRQPPRTGDCDGDLTVSIDELVTGVGIALGSTALSACPRFDGDDSGAVGIDELLTAVRAAIAPALRDAHASLLYTSLTYADPLVLPFDPPLALGGPHAAAAERTLTYCALYDNGFTHPEDVKRNSRVPTNGNPCAPTSCAEGAVGSSCRGDADCGAGDGACDACTVGFGVSTDDEMFVLIGSYVSGTADEAP